MKQVINTAMDGMAEVVLVQFGLIMAAILVGIVIGIHVAKNWFSKQAVDKWNSSN